MDGPVRAQEDAELAARARREPERPALQALYQRYERELFRFLLRLTDDRDVAEDALQETFVLVQRNLHRYDADRPFRPWLLAVARNAGLNALRARRKSAALDGTDEQARAAAAPGGEPGAQAVLAERQDRTRAALAALPDESRALLVQRHALGLTLDELAESWSCSERTIRNRLQRAAEELARALLARGKTEGGTA
jgi:RNA polymerase sigma factor (sigma-70 family)